MKIKGLLIVVCALLLVGSAWAGPGLKLKADLSGAEEVPPVMTGTTGKAKFEVSEDGFTIDFKLDIHNANNILGAAGAHIHCGPAGMNGPLVVFLAGAAMPGFDGDLQIKATLDEDSIVNDACGATLEELVLSMINGNTYVNVHSTDNPGGEVRGQISFDDDDDEDGDDEDDDEGGDSMGATDFDQSPPWISAPSSNRNFGAR